MIPHGYALQPPLPAEKLAEDESVQAALRARRKQAAPESWQPPSGSGELNVGSARVGTLELR